jgi:hypothetical protein
VPYRAKALIEKSQPYRRRRPKWRSYEWQPLEALDLLWNIDKHRSLLLVQTPILLPLYVAHNRGESSGIGFRILRRENEAECWLPLDEGDQTFQVEFEVEVRLAKPIGYQGDWLPWVEQWQVDALADSIFKTVAYRLVPQFRGLLQPFPPR